MEFIERYAQKRQEEIHHVHLPNERIEAGRREIETLKMLHFLQFKTNIHFSGMNILDLGAADQHLRKSVTDEGAYYYPLDIEDINFETDRFPFQNDHFDAVISLAVIEHIVNVHHFFQEIVRVTKPSGFIYLSTPNFRFCYATFYNDPTHVRPFTEISMERLLKMYDYTDIGIFPGLRCKPEHMYTRNKAFEKAARIPFINAPFKGAPTGLYGKATSVFAIGRKVL